MRVRLALLGAVLCLYLAATLCAQDAVKVDPQHDAVRPRDNSKVITNYRGVAPL